MRYLMWTGIFLFVIASSIGSFSEAIENNCDCKWRLLKHYEAKGCQIAQLDSCSCPTQYLCPQSSDTHEEAKACIYQNQEYKLGSRINVTDKCQSCRCHGGERPQIVCRTKECPQLDLIEGENCHLVYENDKCCPSKYECVSTNDENEAIEVGSFCNHEGISYPMGARIYPSEDPCMVCVCNENWQGPSNFSCYHQECLFEKNKMLFNQGCIPIYHENKCCPIEFYCPNSHGIRRNNLPMENDLVAENVPNSDGNCIFGGEEYEIGAELKMENLCINCTCSVPPDFTCVHQSCPKPPSIKNCEVVISTNSCCPSYECFYEDAMSANSSNLECPTPVCNDASCKILIPEGHKCPTCICDEPIVHDTNPFEREHNILEDGPLQINNSSNSEELEKEELYEGISIPVNSDFSPRNFNNSENDQLEILGNGTNLSEEDSSREELDLSLKKLQESKMNSGEGDLLRILRKRSNDYQNNYNVQPQQNHLHRDELPQYQQQFYEEYDMDSNREIEDGNDGFDELKLMRKNAESEEVKLNREELFGAASIIVPAGCPTPICANSSCKIEIPAGHRCPTCVCKRREVWQPR